MSYIVAYVKLPQSRKDCPVACLRTDIDVEDTVLVRLKHGAICGATVTRLMFLDWDCGAEILCKTSEAVRTDKGMKPPLGFPKIVGMATAGVLKDCLLKRGWTPMMPKGRVHSTVLTRCNRKEIANIYLRRRGIDLQILPEVWVEPPRANTFLDCTLSEGRVVRHFLSQTSFNLFEGILRFAKAFENDEDNYGRFFNSVGSRDRKTADIIGSCEEADDGFDAMLYEALGGDGDSVYMGDGLFMGADGSWHD